MRSHAAVQQLQQQYGLPIHLMANKDVLIQDNVWSQIEAILDQQNKLGAHQRYNSMVLTPDLHRGSPVPIGMVTDVEHTVFPGMIGGDIGCGMQLVILPDVSMEDLQAHAPQIQQRLRHMFFGGGRGVVMRKKDQLAMFQHGLLGLADSVHSTSGIWRHRNVDDIVNLANTSHADGSWNTSGVWTDLQQYVDQLPDGEHYDSQLGTVGGGNHFVEIGQVEQLCSHEAAWAWGVQPGAVSVLLHSGSLGFGKRVGTHFSDVAWSALDRKEGVVLPPLPTERVAEYMSAMQNAANFAAVNRMFMSWMVAQAIGDELGTEQRLQPITDMPHNLIWQETNGMYRHRKGAAPALGADGQHPLGHPVLIPGSMGDASWVMCGTGQETTAASAPHGAGRSQSRGQAARTNTNNALQVVLPMDPREMINNGRRDLLGEINTRLGEEAPGAYKNVEAAIASVEEDGAAYRVAKLRPWLTIKGF